MPKPLWTAEQVDRLVREYPDRPTAELAQALNMSVLRVYHKAGQLGLKKSAAYLASPAACRLRQGDNPGVSSRFKKGQSPWNKGMKGLDIGGHATRFQPGHRDGKALQNYRPIGSERLSKEGYLERKIHDGQPMQSRWRAVHLLVWEAAHGAIPSGHAVTFRDGNRQNLALDNLELIPRSELMRRNTVHNYGREIAELVQLRGAITRSINRKERALHE